MTVVIRRMSASQSIAPMTGNQQGLWFIHLASPEVDPYHLSSSLAASFRLTRHDVENASTRLLMRHQVLRTWFGLDEDLNPRQYEDPGAKAEVYVRAVSSAQDAYEQRNEFIRAPFDLSVAPLVRFLLVVDGLGRSTVTICVHHIIADGRSLQILVEELACLLDHELKVGDRRPLKPPAPSFAEFARETALDAGTANVASRDYWRSELSTAVPTYPPGHTSSATAAMSARQMSIEFDSHTTDAVDRQCFERRSTLFCLIATLLVVGLSDCAGQTDVVFGTMLEGRPKPRFARTVGYFANTVAIRAEVRGDDTLGGLMRAVRTKILRAAEHQGMSFSDVVADVSLRPHPDSHPLVSVVYSHLGQELSSSSRLGGFRQLNEPPLHARLPLEVSSQVTDGQLRIMFNFQPNEIEERAVRRIAAMMQGGLQDFPKWCDRELRRLRSTVDTG